MTENYKTVKFGDVAKKINKTVDIETTSLNKYVGGEHMNTDDLRIKEWGVLGDDYLGPAFNKEFKAGQILYGSRRTYLKKVAIPDFDGICSNTTFVIEPTGKGLLPELVPFVMHSQAFTDHSIRESKGSTNPYINWKDIAKYEFAVPASMERQKEIAEVLCKAESAFIKNSQFLLVAEQYKKIMIQELFSKGIGHIKFKKIKNFGNIPAKWTIKKLTEVVGKSKDLIVAGPFGSNLKVIDYKNEGIPIIRLQNIEFGRFIEKDIKFISTKKAKELKYHSFKSGDLILAKLGDPIGKTCIVPDFLKFGIVVADVVRIRNENESTNLYYLLYMLNSSFVSSQLNRGMIGSTRPRVNLGDVRSLLIPYPSHLEQKQIATILSQIDKTINSALLNFEIAKSLKFRLINEYFPSREEVLS